MPRNLNHRFLPIALALCCAAMIAGCASWRGPRIDPTGERFLRWPNEPPIVAPPPFATAPIIAPPPGATFAAPLPGAVVAAPAPVVQAASQVPSTPFGNVVAPPVYTDPPGTIATGPYVGPATPVPIVPTVPIQGAPPLPGPPIAAAPALPPPPPIGPPIIAPPTPIPRCGSDFVRISPNGLIAPVGSEMILKAGIASKGSLLAHRRIDWSIARNGVGQFTELGFRDSGQLLGWWEAPQKLDDWSATSTTAFVPVTLNSSNPNPADDVPIFRGEAWVTVTSPVEGTSIITAATPDLCEFNQASSTIYWIDAQWVLPQPAIVEPGRPHTLTTTVMRRTDGAPLAGWTVRYDVAGGAALGYEGGSSIEATTDAAGRASVEVSPKDAGGGLSNVGITIVRPSTAGPASMPRLELGRWATTVTWNAGGAPVPVTPVAPSLPIAPVPLAPPPTNSAPPPSLPVAPPSQPAPAQQPAPSLPPAATTPAPNPYTAPPAAAATGKPRLEITLRNTGPEQVAVGENAAFELVVTNRGDGIARHIVITDHFDRGLRHPKAQPNEYTVTNATMRDLPPNESGTVRPTFQVVDGGNQCHEVTVTADGAEAVSQKACVTGRQAALDVTITGPRSRVVGQTAEFSTVVKNTGDVEATNIELVIRCDAAIVPTMAEAGSEPLADGGILLKFNRLLPNERRTIGMHGECRSPSNRACTVATITADGGVLQRAEACVEILPVLPDAGATPGGATTAPVTSDLRLTVTVNKNPARVGEKQPITVTVINAGQQTERQIYTRVLLQQEMTPDPTQIQPQNESTVNGQEIRFPAIPELAPGQQKQYIIPVTPNRAGQVQVRADVAATGLVPKTVDSEMIQIVSGSP